MYGKQMPTGRGNDEDVGGKRPLARNGSARLGFQVPFGGPREMDDRLRDEASNMEALEDMESSDLGE